MGHIKKNTKMDICRPQLSKIFNHIKLQFHPFPIDICARTSTSHDLSKPTNDRSTLISGSGCKALNFSYKIS